MDLTLTDEQELIFNSALSFARSAMTPEQIRAQEATEMGFDLQVWRQMVDAGWAGAPFAEKHGGSGLGLFELSLIVTALGQGAVPSPLFSTVIEAGMLIDDFGSTAQRDAWLPRIAGGDVKLTTAICEAGNLYGTGDTATLISMSSPGLRVSGTKMFVRDASVAQSMICLGRSENSADELSFVLVSGDAPGIARRRLQAAGGESLWQVSFNDVIVGQDAILGQPGKAGPPLRRLLMRGAAMKAAELIGIGQAALDLTVGYAKERVQFGKPIGGLQAVHHHCTEMYRDLQVSRLLAWQAAARLGSGVPAEREVAMAKAKASEAIPALTRTAHQIHGAVAYYRDYPLELYYHRAIAAQSAYGDAGHHRRMLAGLMREDVDRFRGDHAHDLPVHYL